MKNSIVWTTLAASSLLLTATSLLPEFQAADKKLNQVYQQLQPKLNSKQKQRLIVAQRSWLKFRDESCDYEAGYFEGGSVAPSIYGYCRARVTKERIKDLEGYLEQASL
ncbi:MAG: DUF1311 domain-containing protein [Oscillatoriales cyanobacterium]|nr:MAG: DUF1311 domain-containing protein [Oscillatoriales cyanobacterium]